MAEFTEGKLRVEFSHINIAHKEIYMVVDANEKNATQSSFDPNYLFKDEAENFIRRWNSQPALVEACEGDAIDETIRLIKESTSPDAFFDRKAKMLNLLGYKQSIMQAAIAAAEEGD